MRRPLLTWPLAGIVVGTAVGYILLGLFRHWHYGTSYDLAIFDQVVWHLSRFETPASTLSGHVNVLGDHFSPILFVLAPLYWVAPRPEILIVAQDLLLALSIVPVYLFARDRLPEPAALALAGAYGVFWGIQRTAFTDFHELAFAPALIAVAIVAMDRRHWRLLWVACGLLMLVKEDLIPLVASFGAFLFFFRRTERRRGVWLAVGASGVFVVVLKVLIPWFNGGAGWNTGGAFQAAFERPWAAPLLLIDPPAKLYTVFMWLAPFLGLPLVSPLGWLLLPIGAERLLSSAIAHWSVGAHYSAPLAPILAMAAADGLSRLGRHLPIAWRSRVLTGTAFVCLISSAVLPGHQPLFLLLHGRHYQDHPQQDTGARALAVIPPTASVVAEAALAPHLSQRDKIYILQTNAPAADYVIGATGLAPWPSETPEQVAALLDARRAEGYVTVFDENGWLVLRR